MLTARDLMTEHPATIRPNAKVRRAAEILQTLDIRHLPVTDDDGTLVGMLSDRDLRAVCVPYVAGDQYVGTVRTAMDASVATLMSADVLSVEAEADAAEIVELMLDNKIGAVPVVDADGALVGIVSYMDVLRALPLEGIAAAE
jgi:acetoin utilization protein AcuB